MSRQPLTFLSTLAVAAIGLAACGGDDDATGPTPATEQTVTQEAPTTPATEPTVPEEDTAPAADETSADVPTLADAPDPGPASEGAVFASGSLEDLPQTVAGLTLDEDSRLPGGMYRDAAGERAVSVNPDNYVRTLDDYAGGLGDDAARGGTGVCGLNGSATRIMCYQQTEDGISFISGDPEEVTVEDMVVFVNQLADELGAA